MEYVTELTAPLINKIDTVYYLTQPFKVLEIANPLKLNKCTDDFTYENIQSGKKYLSRYGFPKGFIIIYEDTTFNQPDYSYKPHIVSSFILKNELLHIYETSKAAYIARARNDAIDTIQKIGENISFYDWYYSYRCKNLKGNNELLKFHTKEKHLFGLMEINNNKILLHYFVNKAELNPGLIGTEKADSIFIKRLNAILPDFNNLRLSIIDLKEQTWGSFDITPNHKIGLGFGWNPNRYTLDTCKSYLIKEDSLISNSIMYYATKEKDLVRAATIDWEDETGLFNPLSEEFIKEKFERKLSVIENCISQKAGKELRREEKKSIIEITWETPSGLMIELEKMSNKNYNNIRLVIYQNK